MEELGGKTAVVTGAASGIGRGLVLGLAAEGMNVVAADIEAGPAEAVAAEARQAGAKAIAAACDVADRTAVGALADRAYAEFGAVHLLCNNAGVVAFRPAAQMRDSDWDWVIGVDLLRVVYGVQAFLSRMLAQGGEAHIVNTASIAGLFANVVPGLASYTTAKYGVVGLSESLRVDLAGSGIGVSVLCPGGVRTQIGAAGRNRQAAFGGPEAAPAPLAAGAAANAGAGMDPGEVAARVIRAVKRNDLYVITHPETRPGVEARFRELLAAYDDAAAAGPPRS